MKQSCRAILLLLLLFLLLDQTLPALA